MGVYFLSSFESEFAILSYIPHCIKSAYKMKNTSRITCFISARLTQVYFGLYDWPSAKVIYYPQIDSYDQEPPN